MRINSVKLRDVRCHREFEATFRPGVVLLLGQNGAGKTSVLMAVNYALFGELPVKTADFVRRGAKSASVEVNFTTGGQQYDVLHTTNGVYRSFQNGNILSDGKVDTEARLKSLLGVRLDVQLPALCRDALSVPQGELANGFTLPDKARFDYWSSILRLDEYRKAWEALRPAARLLEDRHLQAAAEVGVLEGSLFRLVDEIPDDLPATLHEAEATVAGLQKEKRRLSILRDELSVGIVEATRAIAVRRANEARWAEVQSRLRGVSSELANEAVSSANELDGLRRELASFEFDPSLDGKVDHAMSVLHEHRARVDHLRGDLSRATEQLSREESKLEKAMSAKIDAERLSAYLLEKREALAAGIRAQILLESERERAELGQREVSIGKPCPVCGIELEESRVVELRAEFVVVSRRAANELKRVLEEKAFLESEISSAQKALEKAQTEIALTSPDSVSVLRGEVERIVDDLDVAAKELESIEKEHDSLRAAWHESRASRERAATLQVRIARLTAQEIARVAEVDRLEAERERLELEEADLSITLAAPLPESKEDDLRATDASLGRVEEELIVQRDALRDWQTIAELNTQLVEARASAVAAESLSHRLSTYRSVMDAAGPLLAGQVMQRVSGLAMSYWQGMGKDGGLVWDGSFSLSVDGRSFGLLSGGEQIAAALACRMAVAHWLASLDWLVLDEPTIHLDEQARQGLAEAIGQSKLEQVFVVTHDDTFASVASQVVKL